MANHFGVSAVRWNSEHTEIEKCRVHTISKEHGAHAVYQAGEPEMKDFHEVASMIGKGHTVWVLAPDPNGHFDRGDKVRVKHGQNEYIESHNANGGAHSLFDLPTF